MKSWLQIYKILTDERVRHIIIEQPETVVSRENNMRWLNLPDARKAGDAE